MKSVKCYGLERTVSGRFSPFIAPLRGLSLLLHRILLRPAPVHPIFSPLHSISAMVKMYTELVKTVAYYYRIQHCYYYFVKMERRYRKPIVLVRQTIVLLHSVAHLRCTYLSIKSRGLHYSLYRCVEIFS